MTKVELSETKVDSRLQYLLDTVKKGVGIFTEGISKSTEEQIAISFKAFTLKSSNDDEVKMIFDTIMSAVAIELFQQAKEMVKEYTFFHSVEKEDELSHLFLHCDKTRKPPSKSEIDILVKEEKLDTEVVRVEPEIVVTTPSCALDGTNAKEEKKEEQNEVVTLPQASGMSYYRGAE